MNLKQNTLNALKESSNKLAVYTVLTGSKEPLGDPLSNLLDTTSSDFEIDYFCITDNPDLVSDTWRFIILDKNLILPPEKLSRHPKALPHYYFPDYEYSLFIDNIVKFKRLPQSYDLVPTLETDHLFKVYAHYHRTSIVEEALAIAGLKYDSVEVLAKQIDFYQKQMPIENITPLTTGTVLLRQHHHPKIKAHGELWWLHILQFSKRDQMSFDFAVKHVDVKLSYFEGIKNDNSFIHKPNSMSGRVRSSFDPQKYQWIHRNDPEAVTSPKSHFLNHGAKNHEKYEVPNEEAELIAFLSKSSLGKLVSPRRQLVGYLQNIFLRNAQLQGGAYFACFPSLTPTGIQYDQVESMPALQLLFSLAKRYGFTGEIDLKQAYLQSINFTQPLALKNHHKMVILLGFPVVSVMHLFAFLSASLINNNEVKVFIQFDGPLDILVLAWLKKIFSEKFTVRVFEVTSSQHDSVAQAICQSVLYIDVIKTKK